mgnify:CR=1 FL=1
MSVRGANKEIKDYVLEQKGYVAKGEDFKFKSRLSPRTILVTSNIEKLEFDKQTGEILEGKKFVDRKSVV